MKTLYLDCGMGAAGDMLMAALLQLHPEPEAFITHMNDLHIPGVSVACEPAVKCGITGLHVSVKVHDMEEESLDEGLDTAHGQEHTHDFEHEHGPAHEEEHTHDHHHGYEQEHSHDLQHEHEHEHTHAHDHEHEHTHTHNHEHTHTHDHHHHHTGYHDIEHILSNLPLPAPVRTDVLAVYRQIAEAEAHVHGRTVDEIHFHEVGNMDAIADVVGVCLLMHELEIGQVLASPVHVGSGHVHCAHGILPVPAPATAHLLNGVPIYSTDIRGELCTPTGAALLKHFCQGFGPMPVMAVSKIGYGMGRKDFPRANCVRAMLGETEDSRDQVAELCCNLDDITPEAIGFVTGLLLENGALDVYTVAAQMKKNRPGTLLYCMCRPGQKEEMLQLIFRHTTTLGIREYLCSRYTLSRRSETLHTPYGDVRIKHAEGWGVRRSKPEFDDLARIAAREGISLAEAAARICGQS